MRTPNLKLKTELWKRGIKQIDLAFDLRIDGPRLSRIINGREKPTAQIRSAIAGYLDIPEREFFDNE